MPLIITKARINELGIKWNDGNIVISGSYSMMDENGRAITTQSFNGYSDHKIEFNKDTVGVARELFELIVDDIEMETGIKDLVNNAVAELKGGKNANSEKQGSKDSK